MNSEIHSISSRVVTEELHEQFAALCGDRNPMHMDKVAARRTQAGERVVHGVHTLLWALESLVASGIKITLPVRIRAKFLKWAYLGDECVLCAPLIDSKNQLSFQVQVLGLPVLSVDILSEADTSLQRIELKSQSPSVPILAAKEQSFADIARQSGTAFTAASDAVRTCFPNLADTLGPSAVAEIAACSYTVGMEAPGLHSTFSRLDITIYAANDTWSRGALTYRVLKQDPRFNKVTIEVAGRRASGTLDAFVRNPPVPQPSMHEAAANVGRSEFHDMRALIVGGSRGLGELTAKLIAAGGGHSTVTYALGEVEARNVATQIREWGGRADVLRYDVRKDPEVQLQWLRSSPTHLFYYATNPIFRTKQAVYAPSIFEEFARFYLHGFYNLCSMLAARNGFAGERISKLIAFYPSTVYLERRPPGLTEYAMAKAAGEQLCHDMNQYLSGVHVIQARLPRLLTDQTTSVLPAKELNPIDILLPVIRKMRQPSIDTPNDQGIA